MSDSVANFEPQLLSLYILDPKLAQEDSDIHWLSKEAEAIHQGILDLLRNDVKPSEDNLLGASRKYSNDVDYETIEDIMTLDDADPKSIDYYRRRVKEEHLKLNLHESVFSEAIDTIQGRGDLDLERLQSLSNQFQESIDNYRQTQGDRLTSASEFVGSIEKVLNDRDQGVYYSTGDPQLDDYMTYGFSPGAQTTIFSASGIGKTQVKLHLVNQRINLQLPTLSIELEMDNEPLAERLVSMRKKINYKMFHPSHMGEIPPHVREEVEKERKRLLRKSKYFYAINEPELSIDDLQHLVRSAKRKMGTEYLAVFIDLTTMLKDFDEAGGGSQSERYGIAVNRLHRLARKENIHIINIVQANRDFVSSKMKKPEDVYSIIPQPKHVMNSSAFEQRSRTLIGVNRKKFFLEQLFPDAPETSYEDNVMELWFLKQNGGPLGKVEYLYIPEIYTLTKYVREEDEGT